MKKLLVIILSCLTHVSLQAHPLIRTGTARVAKATTVYTLNHLKQALENGSPDHTIKQILSNIAPAETTSQLYKNVQLWLATKSLNLPAIKQSLIKGANPNATFEGNRLPCLYAAVDTVPPYEYPYQSDTSQMQEVIQLLLDHGANPHTTAARNQSVVEYATAQDNSSAVACLLQTQPPALTKTSAIAALYHIACKNDETINGQRIFALIATTLQKNRLA